MADSWECFHAATLELVRSTPIKNRLSEAYRRHLSILKDEQLPREVREDFAKVMHILTCVKPQPGEDRVAASTRKMSNREADECASMIVQIFGAMNSAGPAVRSTASIVSLHPEIDVPATIASINRA